MSLVVRECANNKKKLCLSDKYVSSKVEKKTCFVISYVFFFVRKKLLYHLQ